MYEGYMVIWCGDIKETVKKVNEELAQGYVPIGGIFVEHKDGREFFYQAMAKPKLSTAMLLNTVPVIEKPKKKKKKK